MHLDVEVVSNAHAGEEVCHACSRSFWSVDVEGVVVVVFGEVFNESGKSEEVVAVPVGDEDVGDFWRWDVCRAQLPLCAFTAVDEDVVNALSKEECGVVPFFCWHHACSAEEDDVHRRGDEGRFLNSLSSFIILWEIKQS